MARRALHDQATGWFEDLYRDAEGDADVIPWADGGPHPHLLGWLDQPGLDVTGVDAVVVGCGLGDDAAELARRGCRVMAFDVSPTAVDWARRRFPDLDITWRVEDLLDLPDDMRGAFGLVVEVRTAQSLPSSVRDDSMLAIGSLVGPGGWLVAAVLLATSDEAARGIEGPPWALAPAELTAWKAAGLQRVALDHPPVDVHDPAPPAALTVRTTWRRPVEA